MTTLRDAAQQALEALLDDPNKLVQISENHWESKRDLAVIALRAALAEQVRAAMTRDDIIRMAREADIYMGGHPMNPLNVYLGDLERFAALVAAAEREACAKLCEKMLGIFHPTEVITTRCATAIRARGET